MVLNLMYYLNSIQNNASSGVLILMKRGGIAWIIHINVTLK